MVRQVKQIVFNTDNEVELKMWNEFVKNHDNFSGWVKERVREHMQGQTSLVTAIVGESDIERVVRRVLAETKVESSTEIADTASDIKKSMGSFLKR